MLNIDANQTTFIEHIMSASWPPVPTPFIERMKKLRETSLVETIS